MMSNQDIIVLYSGGTDSTLTAALMAESFEKVHLITYDRFGLFSISNPLLNVQKLKDKFGEDKFSHKFIKFDKLFKYVCYERYLLNLIKHRFFLLSNCGLCKLAMHIRTIIFCLANNIEKVCDGANQGMRLFPAQMAGVIDEIKKMYSTFSIKYTNPVFDFAGPQNTGFADRFHLERVITEEENASCSSNNNVTTGYKLFEIGLMPSENVKGTELDRKMQPRCFQFILFNILVKWYYFADINYEEYEKRTVTFYREKTEVFTELIEEYVKKYKKSKLFKYIEN